MNLDIIARIPPPTDPGTGLTWLFVKKLGQGGFGVASLWYTVDENQNVAARMVIKTQVLVNPGVQLIQDGPFKGTLRESFYQGHLRKSGYTTSIFAESAAPVPGARYQIYRIHMPYYPYGDLERLLEQNIDQYEQQAFPEPFVWFLFLRLAHAVWAMQQTFDGFLLHLDIKPANILFGTPGSLGRNSNFIMYPPAYLADFGISELMKIGEFDLQKQALGSGTYGYKAPEIFKYLRDPQEFESTAVGLPLDSSVNIWQIGRVMLNVLDMDPNIQQIDWIQLDSPKRGPKCSKTEFENVRGTRLWFWSKDLLDLVHECCAFHPFDRPSPRQLLERLQEAMPRHTDGMDTWGTLDWIAAEEARLAMIEAKKKRARDAEEERRKAEEDKNPTAEEMDEPPPSPLQRLFKGVKRVLSLEEAEPSAKRPRVNEFPEGVTRRRQRMVAQQMRDGRTKPRTPKNVLPSDQSFVLDENRKIVYPTTDNMFNIEGYFRQDPPVPPAVT